MGDSNTKSLTSKQVNPPNPTGKGGFQDHPELRSTGVWNPEMTYKFQYKKFNGMKVEEFKDWKENHPDRTMVQESAWNAVLKSRTEHKYLIEIANRTEGIPKQAIDMTTNGENINNIVIYKPEKNKQ